MRLIVLTVACALVLGACGSRSAPAAAIEVTDVWSRPALGMAAAQAADPIDAADQPTAIVYLTIRNSGSAPDRLLKAESPVASVAELHSSTDSNGVMSMRPVDGFDIPAGGTLKLAPAGFHIMLVGLRRDLKLGESFDVVLRFEHAGAISVQSHVRQ